MRIVFMGTPAFALPTLTALRESHHEVVAVYTQPPRPAGRGQKETPSPVHQYATEHGIPVFTPTSLKSKEAQDTFAAHKADVAVVVAYGLLLPKPILKAYPMGCINVHPSLLPRWRGAAPIQRTIMAGDKETAIVIMQMNEGLDTGNMLMVERYPILPGTTTGILHDTLAEKAAPLVLKTLDNYKNITPVKQPEAGVTYASKISKAEAKIDWKKPAQELYQHILGLNPAPGAFFIYNGEMIKVFNAVVEDKNGTAGTASDNLTIYCGKNALRLTELQRPGKKRMNAEELQRGFSIPPGSILE
jgi:methionyl-tRNA formyltransferase